MEETHTAREDYASDVYVRALELLRSRKQKYDSGRPLAPARKRAPSDFSKSTEARAAAVEPHPATARPLQNDGRPQWDDRLDHLPGGLFDPSMARVKITGYSRGEQWRPNLVERTSELARAQAELVRQLESELQRAPSSGAGDMHSTYYHADKTYSVQNQTQSRPRVSLDLGSPIPW